MKRFQSAFTLVELLVMLAVLALLGSILAPALARTQISSKAFQCLNNLRQLQSCWKMYADDNRDNLVAPMGSVLGRPNWCTGFLSFNADTAANWDVNVDIVKSPLFAYCKSPTIFKCPADQSTVKVSGVPTPRVRSVSMSQVFGHGGNNDWLPSTSYLEFFRISDMTRPGPAMTFVFLDEHPDGINDGGFAVSMFEATNLSSAVIMDVPSSLHNGAGCFTFADGHAELHQWQDPRTTPPVRYTFLPSDISCPNNPDVLWISQHTSSKK